MTGNGEISASGKKLGPIGDRILFENEHVRVWIVSLEPGGKQPWHKHYLPYLIVCLTEGKSEIVFEDGTVRKPTERPGDVIWREPGEIHELHNKADWKYQNILVEIKSTAPKG
jgi:beta-alanine degradation protein BauB